MPSGIKKVTQFQTNMTFLLPPDIKGLKIINTASGNYMFKVNNRIKVWNKFKVNNKASERRQWCRTGVFIVNFGHILHLILVFLLLTLRR